MNKYIIEYIKTLSDKKRNQEILIEIFGKILLIQNDLNKFIKENKNKINHILDWINSIVENNEEWKTPRVLTIEALNNAADKYFQKKNNKLQTIELDEKHEKLIADLGDYYVVQMLTPEALDNESKQMQHCIGQGGYDDRLKSTSYKYFSLRDKFNKAHVTIELLKNNIKQLQGKQNRLPEEKYSNIIVPWLINNNYKYDDYIKFGFYIENEKIKSTKDIRINKTDVNQFVQDNKYNVVEYSKNWSLKKNLNYEKTYEIKFKDLPYPIFMGLDKNNKLNFIKENVLNIKGFDNYYRLQKIDYIFYRSLLNFYKKFDLNKTIFDIPIIMDNDLNFYDSIESIKNNSIILSNFIQGKTNINLIPENLTILGDVILNKSINQFPKKIHVKGNFSSLFLNIKNIDSYYNMNIEVEKDYTFFSPNLTIKNHIKTRQLPNNLILHGNLYLFSETYIPDSAIIYGKIFLKEKEYSKKEYQEFYKNTP